MMRVIDEKQSPDLVEGSAILMAEAMGVDNMSTAKAELQQCLCNCIASRAMNQICLVSDSRCLCKYINLTTQGGVYHERFSACDGNNGNEAADFVFDLCKGAGVQVVHTTTDVVEYMDLKKREDLKLISTESSARTTKTTTIGYGQVPYSVLSGWTLLVGVPNTVPSLTVLVRSTLSPGISGYTSTITDPKQPIASIVVGISVTSSSKVPVSSLKVPVSSVPLTSRFTTMTTLRTTSTRSAIFATRSVTSSSSSHGRISKGAIIGVAVGIPVAICGFILLLVLWSVRRRKAKGIRSRATNSPTDSYTDYNQSPAGSKVPSTNNVREVHVDASGETVNELGGSPPRQRFELDSSPKPLLAPPNIIIPLPAVPTLPTPAAPASAAELPTVPIQSKPPVENKQTSHQAISNVQVSPTSEPEVENPNKTTNAHSQRA